MLLWKNLGTDPYRNMATEEYLLHKAAEPSVMLWQNAPAVIIGKNQDARAEVDFDFTKKHRIPVVRRLSGGGAVFHDIGNINYTFVIPDGKALDFAAFTAPVLAALRDLGVQAELSGRNDLVLSEDGRKFSGTAECVINRHRDGKPEKVLLHHGTLLFDADLSALAGALTPDREKLASKGVKSVKSRVCNLKSAVPAAFSHMTAASFKSALEEHFLRLGAEERQFSPADEAEIAALAEQKYKTEEWLFGAFPAEKHLRRRFDFGTVALSLTKKEERIDSISLSGDFFGSEDISLLCRSLSGVPLEKEALENALSSLPRFILGAAPQELAALILEAAFEK